MRFKFLIFYFLLQTTLFSEIIINEKNFKIGIIPFYLEITEDQMDTNELHYLKIGIPKIFLSFLRNYFYISLEDQNKTKIFINNIKEFSKKLSYRIAQHLLLEKQDALNPKDDKRNEKLKQIALLEKIQGIVYGNIVIKKDSIIVDFYFKNLENLQEESFHKSINLNQDNPYDDKNQKVIQKLAEEYQIFLMRRNNLKIQIENKNNNDYYVFVNQLSYGKNIKNIDLPTDVFEIQISSENCHKKFIVQSSTKIVFECKEEKVKYFIDCKQGECEVFIDEKFIGKTPIIIELPKKIYRIRISKENYLEKNYIVNVNSSKNLYAILKPEDKNFKNNKFNYYDLSFTFGIQTLFLGILWVNTNIEKERQLDKLISYSLPASYLLLNRIPEYNLYQHYMIEQNRKKTLKWHRKSQIYGSLSIASLVGSIYFLYKGIQIDIENTYEYAHKEIRFFYRYDF